MGAEGKQNLTWREIKGTLKMMGKSRNKNEVLLSRNLEMNTRNLKWLPQENGTWNWVSVGHLMRRVDSLEKTLMLGGIGAGGEGDDRGWDGWMASPTRWTWVWVNSGSWWCTGRPGMLRFMGSQRAGRDWATELSWRIMYSARNGNQQLACSRAIDKSFEWSADLWRWHSMTTTLYCGHKGKHTWPCTWEMVFQGRSWSLKYLDMI